MSNDELLIIVARALNDIGAEWMLTGSNASSFLGVPRTTHDIDFVIDFRCSVSPAIRSAYSARCALFSRGVP